MHEKRMGTPQTAQMPSRLSVITPGNVALDPLVTTEECRKKLKELRTRSRAEGDNHSDESQVRRHET